MSKDDLLAAMLRECDLCIHLHGKVPEGGMEFRFTPSQRSTAELLRYLSFIGVAAVKCFSEGSWDAYGPMRKKAEGLAPEEFPAAMKKQKAALKRLFGKLTEADLRKRKFEMPWGGTMTLGPAIVALGLSSLTAYRMQLFLHAKAAGNASIGTSNCWGGFDTKAE